MNDGYFFIIMLWLGLILLSTHWLDFLWTEKDNLYKKRQKAILFLLLVISTQGFYLPFFNTVFVNVGVMILLSLAIVGYIWRLETTEQVQMISIILFLGVSFAVLYEMLILDPIFMILSPVYLLPALLASLIIFTVRQLRLQMLLMMGGCLLGEIIHKYYIYKHVHYLYLGDALFRDQLMVGVVILFITRLLLHYCSRLYLYARKVLITVDK